MKALVVNLILTYLRLLAKLQLVKNHRATIIGITGSAGKTSTRSALTLILKSKGRVKESLRANSESGIPLNILGLAPKDYSLLDWLRLLILAPLMLLLNWERFDYYVVEMGIDSPTSPKNMAYLLRIIRPHVGIILNAGLVHGEAFDHLIKDRDPARRMHKIKLLVAKEKMQLANGVSPEGVVIYNFDQPELKAFAKGISARVIKFGRLKGADFRFTGPKLTKGGFTYTFNYQGKTHSLTLPDLYEANFAYTFSAAIASASALGVNPTSSLKQLSAYRAPAGRLRTFAGLKDTTIIDSSYNASPESMQNALSLLSSAPGQSPKLAVVGDMRELGIGTKYAHKLLADWLIKYADRALLFGSATKTYTLPVLVAHKFPARHFDKMPDLIAYLETHLPAKALVLVKGSQNTIFLERAVESLLANPTDVKQLCRRGKYWDNQRVRTP